MNIFHDFISKIHRTRTILLEFEKVKNGSCDHDLTARLCLFSSVATHIWNVIQPCDSRVNVLVQNIEPLNAFSHKETIPIPSTECCFLLLFSVFFLYIHRFDQRTPKFTMTIQFLGLRGIFIRSSSVAWQTTDFPLNVMFFLVFLRRSSRVFLRLLILGAACSSMCYIKVVRRILYQC